MQCPNPFARPRFTKLTLKNPNATESTVELDGEAAIHWASTGKVEIWAKWEDPVDDPSNNRKPGCENHEILVQSFDIPEEPDVIHAPPGMPTLTRVQSYRPAPCNRGLQASSNHVRHPRRKPLHLVLPLPQEGARL